MPSMTRIALIEKPAAAAPKEPKVRRYFIVRLPPKYDHLRRPHD